MAVDLYDFVDALSDALPDDAVVVSDAGSAFFVVGQALKIRGRQRWVTSGGQAEMGYTVPACIGVAATGRRHVYGITGDGSLQMNVQELQTIAYHQMPVLLFVWDNGGYLSIRNSQRAFFGRTIGESAATGVTFPALRDVAETYGMTYAEVTEAGEVAGTLYLPLPALVRVVCDPLQKIRSGR